MLLEHNLKRVSPFWVLLLQHFLFPVFQKFAGGFLCPLPYTSHPLSSPCASITLNVFSFQQGFHQLMYGMESSSHHIYSVLLPNNVFIQLFQVIDGVEISLEPKTLDDVIGEVVRATKSVLEISKPEEIFEAGSGTNKEIWIPKKTVPTVAVSNTGYFLGQSFSIKDCLLKCSLLKGSLL